MRIGTVDLDNKREVLGKYNEALGALGGNPNEISRAVVEMDWSAYCALIDADPDRAMEYYDALVAQFVLEIGKKAQALQQTGK